MNVKKKRVLIVANIPQALPRLRNLVEWLPYYGWEPVILTIKKERNAFSKKVEIIETPFETPLEKIKKQIGIKERSIRRGLKRKFKSENRLIDKFIFSAASLLAYPDPEREWKELGIKAANERISKGDISAIITSSTPYTTHLIGSELKKKWNLPWIADLRDLWTLNHTYPYGKLRKWAETALELKTLKHADHLIAFSKPLAEKMEKMHNKPCSGIPSMGSLKILNKKALKPDRKFTITYTGQIYNEQRYGIDIFLRTIKRLILSKEIDKKKLEIRFYGDRDLFLTNSVNWYNLEKNVKLMGRVSHKKIVKIQRKSQILLLANWQDPTEWGLYPFKLFEYLVAKRPILAVGGHKGDVVDKLLRKTKTGSYCEDWIQIVASILKSYNNYLKTGDTKSKFYKPIGKEYTNREVGKRFADILKIIGC